MVEMLDVLMGPRDASTADHPWHRAERGSWPPAGCRPRSRRSPRRPGSRCGATSTSGCCAACSTVHHDVVERIGELRAEGYRTGLLTNSFKEFRDHIEAHVDFSVFDVVVDSSEVGFRKPEPEIYDLTTELLGVPAEQILYLDDFAANLVGAEAAGWQTIHVTDVECRADRPRPRTRRRSARLIIRRGLEQRGEPVGEGAHSSGSVTWVVKPVSTTTWATPAARAARTASAIWSTVIGWRPCDDERRLGEDPLHDLDRRQVRRSHRVDLRGRRHDLLDRPRRRVPHVEQLRRAPQTGRRAHAGQQGRSRLLHRFGADDRRRDREELTLELHRVGPPARPHRAARVRPSAGRGS